MTTPLHVLFVFALALSFAAAVTDLGSGRIPNHFAWLGCGAGLLGNTIAGALHGGASGLFLGFAHGALGALVCALLPLALFWLGGLAGGDVKLFVALGTLLGPAHGFRAELYAFVAGALFALSLLAYERALLRTVLSSFRVVSSSLSSSRGDAAPALSGRALRFAPAIFAGTLFTIFQAWSA